MYAAIMGGMNAQRKENTANRRASSKLFADYVKSQREQGIELTEQGMTDQWNSNSAGVGLARGRAPTKERMQGIMTAQTESDAKADKAQQYQDFQNNELVMKSVKDKLADYFGANAYDEAGNGAGYKTVMDQFGEGSLMGDALDSYSDSGRNFGVLHNQYNSGQLVSAIPQVTAFAASGMSADEIKKHMFNVPPSIVDQALADYQKAEDGKQGVRDQLAITQNQTNKTAARAELINIASSRDISPEEATQILEAYGVTDEAQQATIMATVESSSQQREASSMSESNQVKADQIAKAVASNGTTVASIRESLNSNAIANFTNAPEQMKGPINSVLNTYMVEPERIQELVVYVNENLDKLTELNSSDVQANLANFLKTAKFPTYSSHKTKLDQQSIERVGLIQYTTDTFNKVYIRDFKYEADLILGSIQSASEVGNERAYLVATAALSKLLDRTRHDLSRRQADRAEAFGKYSQKDEVNAAIDEGFKMIQDFSTQAQVFNKPEEVTETKTPVSKVYSVNADSTTDIKTPKDALEIIDWMLKDANRIANGGMSANMLNNIKRDIEDGINQHPELLSRQQKLKNKLSQTDGAGNKREVNQQLRAVEEEISDLLTKVEEAISQLPKEG